MKEHFENRLTFAQWLLLLTIPTLNFALIVYLTFKYTVDVPVWDEWVIVQPLIKSYQHTLTLHDLWAQHNEHRFLFPRIIMLTLAHLSQWNLRWEQAASLLFTLGTFGVLVYQLCKTAKLVHDKNLLLLLPPVGLTVFSCRQYVNWMWSFQLALTLEVLCVVTGIVILTLPGCTAKRLVVTILLGFVATYSFANGLFYWIIGVFVLALTDIPPPKRRTCLTIWCFATILIYGFYFYQYVKPVESVPLTSALSHPISVLLYMAIFLGGLGFKGRWWFSAMAGVIGVVLYIIALRSLRNNKRVDRQSILPYHALFGFAILSAFASALGRVHYGLNQALEPRYVTFSQLYWIAIVTLVFLALRPPEPVRLSFSSRQVWVMIVFSVIVALPSYKARTGFQQYYDRLLPEQQHLRNNELYNSELLFPDENILRMDVKLLRQYRLNVFRSL